MSIPLKTWLDKARPDELRRLAKLARTSVKTIQNVARGFRKGSAEFAVRLGRASIKLRQDVHDTPGLIDQGTVCPACRKCPHYRKD